MKPSIIYKICKLAIFFTNIFVINKKYRRKIRKKIQKISKRIYITEQRKILRPLEFEQLKSIKHNSNCYIVASGPSATNINYNLICNADIMAVNGSFNILKNIVNPEYYFVTDSDFLTRDKNAKTFCSAVNASKCFITYQPIRKPIKRTFEKCNNKNIYLIDHAESEAGFSTKKENPIPHNWTVVSSAVQLAYQLGYNNVFISGLDLTSEKRCYHEKNPCNSRIDKDFKVIENFFKITRSICDNEEFKVYNLSQSSKLRSSIIPKIQFKKSIDICSSTKHK